MANGKQSAMSRKRKGPNYGVPKDAEDLLNNSTHQLLQSCLSTQLQRSVQIAEAKEHVKAQHGPVKIIMKDGKRVTPLPTNKPAPTDPPLA